MAICKLIYKLNICFVCVVVCVYSCLYLFHQLLRYKHTHDGKRARVSNMSELSELRA